MKNTEITPGSCNTDSYDADSPHYDVKRLGADERFFRRRGLPTLIEDYSATEDILTRTWPWLVLFFFIQVGRSLWTSWEPLVAGVVLVVALIALALVSGCINAKKGKTFYALPQRVGWWSAAVFILVPSLMRINSSVGYLPALKHIGFNTLIVLALMGIIGWGLAQTVVWAVFRVLSDLSYQLVIVFRQMAAIFLFAFLLFFSQEIWQFADNASQAHFEAFSWVITFLCLAVIISGVPRLSRSLINDLVSPSYPVKPVQKANIMTLLAIRQLGQVLVIMAVTTFIFILLSVLLISPELLKTWNISNVPLERIELFDQFFIITSAGIYVAVFLGLLAGLNFSAISLNSKEGREQFMEGLEEEFSYIFRRRESYIQARLALQAAGHKV